METLLWACGGALALWVVSVVAMVLLAHHLPPGLLRQVMEFLPACVTTARRLRRSPDVPRRAKVALLVAVAWVVSPIDLLPEFLPVIGPLDDVLAVVLLLRYAARSVPRAVLLDAWPADPALLERLLGGSPRARRLPRAAHPSVPVGLPGHMSDPTGTPGSPAEPDTAGTESQTSTPESIPDGADVPTTCETCGTTLETGMVGVAEADIGNTPDLPATTVFEVFCPNPDCPAHKPTPPDADAPGSVGGDNGGA